MASRSAHVLVVEDEPLIRISLVMAFEEQGFRTLEASNVPEAVAVLSREEVDALVTDIDMQGGMSGLDLVELVSTVSLAALVVVSGRALPPDYVLPQGAAYIPKPYSLQEVVAEVCLQIGDGDLPSLALAG